MEDKLLSQDELSEIFEAQKAGDYSLLQKNQLNLRKILISKYEKNWENLKKKYPYIKPIFDVEDSGEQIIEITKDLAEKYNLLDHLKEFDHRSENSTAGIRGFYDILHSENPGMMYNDLFVALLVDAEADFMKEVHEDIRKKIEDLERSDPDFKNTIDSFKQAWGDESVSIIEEIFNLPLGEIITFLKNNVVKLVGGEVRAHTEKFVELETRILASKGITVITAEKYSDSIPIYMHSFLTYLLGVTGSTNYTPSHSPNYLFGRKVIAFGGCQLLPDKYESYRSSLRQIVEKEIIEGGKYSIKLSSSNNKNIRRTLKYEQMVKLYRQILNTTRQDVEIINKATNLGHKIKLNNLNGSTWKTFSPLLDELKIDKSVFDLVFEKEDPFFETGYVVTKEKGSSGKPVYNVDHLGTDVSMSRVATTVPYAEFLASEPVGSKLYECDADSDRFCVKQVIENSDENIAKIKEFGLDNYQLTNEKILVALSPNKSFLLLDMADYERMVGADKWNEYYSLYAITYVSTKAWPEFASKIPGMITLLTRVGFKNLTEIQQMIEKWYFDQPDIPLLETKDQLGNTIKLDRNKKLRVHCKEEESGGRVAGTDKVCLSILGDRSLAMPEKSDPDSVLSELVLSSNLFIDGEMSGNYRYLAMLENSFSKYDLKSKVDVRFDIMHGDQGAIAMMDFADQKEALQEASDLKTNFNNFFFSLGFAVRENEIELEQVVEIMTKVIPELSQTWKCLSSITLSEEPLAGGRTRPEGVPMIFKDTRGQKPLVTEFDFRPSGTDPLKSKVYVDAEELSTDNRKLIEKKFVELSDFDLFTVLDDYGINSIASRPNCIDKLKKI